jgi:hypothetical protein
MQNLPEKNPIEEMTGEFIPNLNNRSFTELLSRVFWRRRVSICL